MIETGLFRFAGENELLTLDNLARPALEIRHLRRQLFEMLIKTLHPERQPAGGAFHEADSELREAVEHPLAYHVHHGDHQLEGEGCHVDIGIFEKTRAACRHHTGDSGNSFVAGLWMNAQSHAD